LFSATAKIGAILVNINPTEHELEYALNHSGCKSIVGQNKYADYSQMLYELIPISKAMTFDCEEFPLKSVISLSTNNLREGMCLSIIQIDYHELETRQRTLSFDDPININLPVVQLEVQRSNIKQYLKQLAENTTHH
jgi:fatty-acyl-CoA synthase